MKFFKAHHFRRNGCSRCQRCFGSVAVVIAIIFVVYVVAQSQLAIVDHGLIQLEKCPACFGISESVCLALRSGELKVRASFFWKSESIKGVLYGIWDDLPVVVKTLGSRKEMEFLDKEICNYSTASYCNVREIVFRSLLNPSKSFKSSVMQFMECPADHFADLLEYNYGNNMGIVYLQQKIMVMTNLHFNQEFLFLEIFAKRYPQFLPKLYGACGRIIVVENVGPTLSSALSYSWLERVKVSLKLIQLARKFTRTVDNLALYLYDVIMDNFAIDKHGNVKLIDCEHILIVDMGRFNTTYDIKAEDACSPTHFECLTFIPSDLCQGESQDHNYYAVCRNLLAGIGGSSKNGLLHSPPTRLVNSTFLKYLLHNCVYGKQMSRERAIYQLENELRRFQNMIF